MTNKFKEVLFETLYAEPSRNGLTKPRSVRGKGYKMINMGELFAYGRINNPKMDLVPLNENEIKNTQIQEGDLLFARQSLIASGAGKCSIVLKCPEITTFESHLIRVRLNKKFCNPLFYYYYFSSPIGTEKTQSLVSQVAAAGIRGSELAKLNVHYIDLKTQDKIAQILSNYDDLIENNNRRIKILEEMAQKIYKEWFVDFKFPGHETSTFKDSPLGKIPNDWEVKKIGKEYKTYLGGTPSRNEIKYWNGDIPWLNSGKTNELRITEASEYITKAGLEKSSTKLMPKFTTVLAITGATLGQVSMLGDEMCANQSVVGVYSNTNQEFVFYLLKDKIKKLIQNASGGAQQHINKDIVNEMEFILPTNNILNDFTNILKPINLEIFNLLHKNRVLKQTRDTLLPRLISGEINVENMEIL